MISIDSVVQKFQEIIQSAVVKSVED